MCYNGTVCQPDLRDEVGPKGQPAIRDPKIPSEPGRLRSLVTGLMPLFVLAHFSHHVVGALLPPLQPFIRDSFLLNKTQIGLLGSAYNIPYGLGQLPGGWLSDRLGPRRLITVGVAGVAVAGLAVGLSPTYGLVAFSLVLLGLFGGGYHPAASPLVSASVGEEQRGAALGVHQIGGTASFFMTPLIAVGIAAAIGWRGSFIAMAIPTFIFGIVLYMILGRQSGMTSPTQTSRDVGGDSGSVGEGLGRLVPFIALAVILQVLVVSTATFVPLFVVDTFGVSEAVGGGLLALVHAAGLPGGPLGGYLSDRVGKVPVLLAAGLVAGPAIYLLSFSTMGWSIWLVLFLMGTCQYIAMPVSESYIITHTTERNRSTVLGIYYLASRGGPGLILPVLGYLIDRYGFSTSFSMAGATMAAAAIVSVLFLRRGRD